MEGDLPERQISDDEVEELREIYRDLLGFVPPRIQDRTDLLSRIDPQMLSMQEEVRKHCMYPEAFDVKTSQLMLFGMLLITLRDAARLHGIGARRAGATWEELQAVANMAYLFGGLSVANRAAQYMREISEMEARQGDEG